MAQAVSVMRWDDTSAPDVVDGKPSEYMTVLKKCLVDGYGTTPGLNWIVVVDEILTTTPLLVLKNDVALGGSGGFIVFKADNDTAGTLVKVQCCQAYIDRDTLTNPGAYFVFSRYNSTEAGRLNKWMLTGTETGFYFFVTNDYVRDKEVNSFETYGSIFFWVGDFQSFHDNDASRFITMSGGLNNNSHSWTSSLNYRIAHSSEAKNITYVYALDSSYYQEHSVGNILGSAFGVTGEFTEEPSILSLSECFLLSTLDNTPSLLNKPEMPRLRGKVPGLYISSEVGFFNNAMPFIKEIDGVNYFNIPNPHNATSFSWINLEEW